MSLSLRRRLADLTCRSLCGLLPAQLRVWGEAVRADVAQIRDDNEALLYALSSFGGFLPRTLSMYAGSPIFGDPVTQSFSWGSGHVPEHNDFQARKLVLACGVAAAFLGLIYLWMSGAPSRYLAINCVALLVGYVLLAILERVPPSTARSTTIIWLSAAALLLTAMLGQSVEGASRWFRIAGLSVQPSLILSPLMVLCFARASTWLATAGVVVVALAIALQPDAGMAGVLAAGLVAIALLRRDATAWAAASAGTVGLAATLAQPDQLSAAPHVDQILYSAFSVHPAAGLAVLTGAVLLVLPAAIAWVRDPQERLLYGALGAVWLAAIAAAALNNYPTPVVGYGGSAIIGYILALAALPKSVAHSDKARSAERAEVEVEEDRSMLLAAAAL